MARTKFRNDMTITGGLTVSGPTTLTGAVAATGSISTSGSLSTVTGITVTMTNGTAVAGAVTVAGQEGKITSEALTTAQNAIYTLTITNSAIAAADIVLASVANGTNTQGSPVVTRIQPAAGSVVILVANLHASAQALNGTIVVSYVVMKAAA